MHALSGFLFWQDYILFLICNWIHSNIEVWFGLSFLFLLILFLARLEMYDICGVTLIQNWIILRASLIVEHTF
jgi:ABC-type microcin C transport system permease subunit YejE